LTQSGDAGRGSVLLLVQAAKEIVVKKGGGTYERGSLFHLGEKKKALGGGEGTDVSGETWIFAGMGGNQGEGFKENH